jgi:hypothetical protein
VAERWESPKNRNANRNVVTCKLIMLQKLDGLNDRPTMVRIALVPVFQFMNCWRVEASLQCINPITPVLHYFNISFLLYRVGN